MGIMDWLDPDADEREQTQARRSRGREAFGRAGGMPFTGASGFHQWAQNAMAPGMAAHADAAGAINDAVGREMQSRVAQGREMRRMEHEKAMMEMRIRAQQEAAQADRDGALIRAILNG